VSPINFPQEFLETIGTNSVYANATFNFNETYFLEGSYRVDQSSTLPKENNTYTYPSITGTYVFSNHIDAGWLSFGKLRLNYAETGNDAEFAVIQSTYDKLSNFGPDGIRFSNENNKSNANLNPELTKGYEAGIELKFLKNRVGLDFSYYKTNTTNQILSIETPSQTGYSRSWINAGDVENKGYELSLNVIPFKTKDFSWEARINWATNKNKVIDLGGAERFSIGSTQGIGYIAEVGKPIGQLIGRGYKYLDGQKVVKDNGLYEVVNGATIGDVNPEWTGGINNILNYKNFTFNFLIDIKKGGDVYSLDQQYGHTTGIYQSTVGNNHLGNPVRNSIADGGGIILDGVKANGTPNTTVVLADYDTYNSMPQERYVYDASYVKLREVGLSYKLPSKYLKNTFMNSVIFAVNGSNLWIISKNLPYADPEAGTSSGNLQGFQSGVLPTTKEYNFNLKVQF
jgi:outer membrane receptor protein involved in Fe transport